MKEFNLHFYTSNPCNVFINGELIGYIDNNEKFFIDLVVFSPELIVTCEPISSTNELLIPFSFKLQYVNNKLLSSIPNALIVPFPNKHFDVVVNFKSVVLNNKTSLFNKKVGNYNILAMIDSVSTISIFNNDTNLFTTKTNHLTDFNAELLGNLIIASAKSDSNKFLLVFNTSTNNILVSDIFLKVEKTENNIKALKSLNNTLKHGKVFSIDVKTGEVTNYNVYLEDYKPLHEQNLIPLSFLESIKAEDYKLAMTFLDGSLLNVNELKLKQYFNEFENIYYNCYNLKQDVCNYTITGKENKNFNFYLLNNKIIEIEEVEL